MSWIFEVPVQRPAEKKVRREKVNVGQIIKRTNHEEKLKQKQAPLHSAEGYSHTICISGAQSGE